MMSKLVSDLFDIAEFAHHGPENLFISVIKHLVGSFIFLTMINWRLTMILAVVVGFMVIFSVRQNKRMQATFMDNRRKIGDINASLQDNLAGIRVVQSFANEEIEWEKFTRSNEILFPKEITISAWDFYEWKCIFPGTDVSFHAGIWRFIHCAG